MSVLEPDDLRVGGGGVLGRIDRGKDPNVTSGRGTSSADDTGEGDEDETTRETSTN
jgi:hypothetical protein